MGKVGRPTNWNRMAISFIDELHSLGYSRSWTRKMKNVLIVDCPSFFKVLHPSEVNREQYVHYVAYLVESHENADYRRQKLSCLNRFLSRYGNYVYQSVPLHWEKWEPKNVYWLSWEQVGYIWSTPMNPVEKAMIWMESRLGCRRIEVLRQRFDEINLALGTIYIRGKGGSGHRGRRLALPPSGYEFIPLFNEFREKEIQRFLDEGGDPDDLPKEWIIYFTRSRPEILTTLKPTTADNLLKGISDRCGIQFTHHVLRRSFCRHLFDIGVPSEKARKISGHSSVKMFERYIGITDDDIKEAMMMSEAEELTIQQEINNKRGYINER